MTLTIVGLGPGDGRYLTREAWQVLCTASTIAVRTARHPAVADLPDGANIITFDEMYNAYDSFEAVYAAITRKVMALGRAATKESTGFVYAVPGHPLVGESTVTAILAQAQDEGLAVQIVDGLSFIEPTLTALGQDAFEGLQLFDALEVAAYSYPPVNSDHPVLLGQVYDRLIASEVKLALMSHYADDHEVVLVHGAGTGDQNLERLPLYGIDRSDKIGHLTTLFVPPLPEAGSLAALVETVAHLRGPDGCPWDQEQTSRSLRAGFLEEASEVLQAIDDEDYDALREELGDLFYHLVMQVQIASEQEEFRLNQVIGGIISKLIRRHPHVWGDVAVSDSDEVIRNWNAIKDTENDGSPHGESVLDSVPYSMPALARAQKIQERVSRVGFDWPDIEGVEAKIVEEIAEIRSAGTAGERQMELGDLLFALVNWVRWLDVDAESALRDASRRFEARFRLVERFAAERALELAGMSIDGLNELWEEAKEQLDQSGDKRN